MEARDWFLDTLAPWAEIVPTAEPMTVGDLLALPDDGWQYELVEGRLVRMAASGGEASRLALRIGARLTTFVEDHQLGAVTGADGTYDLSPPGTPPTAHTDLVPDVAFVRAEHVPPRGSRHYAKAWRVAPDLVIEVASPSQHRPEMRAKALRYLAAGCRLVWVVWPRRRQVDVWRVAAPVPARVLGTGDTLDGEDAVPGFSYPLASLFA